MITVFTTTTKNYDLISIVMTNDEWYEVYFNNRLQQQCISLSEALREVEKQLSL